MQTKKQAIDTEEDDYFSQKLERKFAFMEKVRNGNRPYPKQPHQLLSINDILEDLEFPLKAFPEAAIRAALDRKEEITPLLLKVVEDALVTLEDETYLLPLFSLYILSQFREKKAFPLMIRIARLPEERLDDMLGDALTENLHQFIGSTYDGNLEAIKALVENSEICVWSRDAALRSFLVLLKAGVLERDDVLDYMKTLFHHVSFIDDEDAMANLISAACDLCPEEIYAEIKEAYEMKRVNTSWIGLKDVDRSLQLGKAEALKRDLYENSHWDFITDVIEETSWWAYTKDPEKEVEGRDESFFKDPSTTFRRETPKLGRNDLCLCGSGKKYKKCCL